MAALLGPIRVHFDTHRFANDKEPVVDLLARVTTMSVATVGITRAMRSRMRWRHGGPQAHWIHREKSENGL